MLLLDEDRYLECREYRRRTADTVDYYILRLVNKEDGATEEMRFKPEELSSYQRFKVALLKRCILYTATNAQHRRTFRELFIQPLRQV
jgi:hypothetical protein